MARCLKVAALLSLCLALAACGDDPGATGFKLDGSPRRPDAAGVVVEVDRSHLVLDDGERFTFGRDLQAFASRTGGALSILRRKGEYVHVGADRGKATWVASIGAVVPLQPPVVFYLGVIEHLEGQTLVFRDGTVLEARPGLRVIQNVPVRVEIDVSSDEVTSLTAS